MSWCKCFRGRQERAGRGGTEVRDGFTLVELLVVIGIIGILAAFLIPASLDAFGRSQRNAAEALIKKLENGLRMYESQFQKVPDRNITLTVKKARQWQDIEYSRTMKGQSAQMHALLGAKLRHVQSVDPATGNITYGEVGPYVNFTKKEVMDGEKNNYRKPLIDPWENILRVRFNGQNHTNNSRCGTRNNNEWVDIWSEGPRIEEDNLNDGCDDDDINNFGKLE